MHVYTLGPYEKEKVFNEHKRSFGSLFSFHGSGIGNWHPILRTGLKNMSGTAGQINGAAYGSGIYVGNDMRVAHFYSSSMCETWYV